MTLIDKVYKMKFILSLNSTYANVIGPLNENFDSIEHQWSEILETQERAELVALVLEFAINDMDTLSFTENVRNHLGEEVSSSFINEMLLNVNLAMVLKTFNNEAKNHGLDLEDGYSTIRVIKFGPNLSVLEQ